MNRKGRKGREEHHDAPSLAFFGALAVIACRGALNRNVI